jgi:hypothetical protein
MNKAEIIEKTNTQFSHQHSCDVEGHYYDCTDDCECICGLPMNGNDHGDCPVELRPCPKHKEQEPMPEEALPEGVVEVKFPPDWQHTPQAHCQCGCSEIDLIGVVGWCLHCDHVYANYTPKVENRHFAYYCPGVPETVKEAARARLAS